MSNHNISQACSRDYIYSAGAVGVLVLGSGINKIGCQGLY